jgi:UPF0755 protein
VSDDQDILPAGYAEQEPWSGGAHRSRRDRGEGRRGRRRHPVLTVLLIIVALILTIAIVGFVWTERQINPAGHHGPNVAVQIPTGASTARIGSILAKAGVVHDASLFALYVRVTGAGPLYPGAYHLAKNSSYGSTISILEAGPKLITERLVIPEGFTIRQIAAAVGGLPVLHLSAQKFLAAATDGDVRSPYEPAGVQNLEGLVFPATYQVQQGESEVDLLEQLIGTFNNQADEIGLTAAAARLHLTPYQVVTVASIVEREAKLPQDRGPVASVLYNRLRAGMSLGADSTQTYYLRLTQPNLVPTAGQLNEPSPYNTRLNKGLPPTPIANAGLPSLLAATAPPSTSYLYFVEINPDGQLGYASNPTGFAQLQADCQRANLC